MERKTQKVTKTVEERENLLRLLSINFSPSTNLLKIIAEDLDKGKNSDKQYHRFLRFCINLSNSMLTFEKKRNKMS